MFYLEKITHRFSPNRERHFKISYLHFCNHGDEIILEILIRWFLQLFKNGLEIAI